MLMEEALDVFAMELEPSSPSPLHSLPPSLLARVLSFCPGPRSLASLAAASRETRACVRAAMPALCVAWYGSDDVRTCMRRHEAAQDVLAVALAKTDELALFVGVGEAPMTFGSWLQASNSPKEAAIPGPVPLDATAAAHETLRLPYRKFLAVADAVDAAMPNDANVAPADVRAWALLDRDGEHAAPAGRQRALRTLAAAAVVFAARQRWGDGWLAQARACSHAADDDRLKLRVVVQTFGKLGSTSLWRCRNDTSAVPASLWTGLCLEDNNDAVGGAWGLLRRGLYAEVRKLDLHA